MLALALTLAAHADERSAPAPIPLIVDPFVGKSPARIAGGADAAWQDDTTVGARASIEGAFASRFAARVSVGVPVSGNVESDIGGEARLLLTPHDFAVDGAVGLRYKKIGFEGVENEVEGFVALAHDAGKSRFVVNGVVGRGVEEGKELEGTVDTGNGDEVTYEDHVESDAELGGSWSLHVNEHAAIGALARGRWSERRDDATVGPTIGFETGGLSAVALIGGTNVEGAGWGVRSGLIVQLAL
jgi:hypothetical protein